MDVDLITKIIYTAREIKVRKRQRTIAFDFHPVMVFILVILDGGGAARMATSFIARGMVQPGCY